MADRLKGKTVLVTGSGRGFGQAMAVAFAAEGAHVVSTARTMSELRNTEHYIQSVDGRVSTVPCDLSRVDSVQELVIQLVDLGGVDVIVNNAATSPWKTIDDMTIADWNLTLDVNLRAPFMLAQGLYRNMADRGGGGIINISSGSATRGFMAELAYCPSKYGLEGLTQCLALELKNYNIAVNSLNVGAPPGYKLKPTELTEEEALEVPEEVRSRYAPVDLMVQHFSNAWVFLAQQKADGITGQRFSSRKLAEELMALGEAEIIKRYRGKLSESVYQGIDFPEKVKYQTREGGWKEIRFT
ncbi:MAG: SDR family oxidoreductase [Candidatus Bathyarchaeota archaeon]|nr:SDR family oxidoreductase [Candidatus Bathyarchaeota archaeon]